MKAIMYDCVRGTLETVHICVDGLHVRMDARESKDGKPNPRIQILGKCTGGCENGDVAEIKLPILIEEIKKYKKSLANSPNGFRNLSLKIPILLSDVYRI